MERSRRQQNESVTTRQITARQETCVTCWVQHQWSGWSAFPKGWTHYRKVSTCICLTDKALHPDFKKEQMSCRRRLTLQRIRHNWKCENVPISITRTCTLLSPSPLLPANKSNNFPGLWLDVEVLRPPIPQWQLMWAMVQYWFSMCKNKILVLPSHRSTHLHETENTTFKI